MYSLLLYKHACMHNPQSGYTVVKQIISKISSSPRRGESIPQRNNIPPITTPVQPHPQGSFWSEHPVELSLSLDLNNSVSGSQSLPVARHEGEGSTKRLLFRLKVSRRPESSSHEALGSAHHRQSCPTNRSSMAIASIGAGGEHASTAEGLNSHGRRDVLWDIYDNAPSRKASREPSNEHEQEEQRRPKARREGGREGFLVRTVLPPGR